MIDLHTHSLLSDGVLVPSELVRRAAAKGYRAMAITDHVDTSNFEEVSKQILAFVRKAGDALEIPVIPGVELTHVPPELIREMVKELRALGIPWIVVHGETIVEPVKEGTNHAAILSGADLLAHPGLITEEDVRLAADREVFLEISARKGHSLGNGHVAALAMRFRAKLLLNTDTHAPSDLISTDFAKKVALGCGLTSAVFETMRQTALSCTQKVL